MRGEAHARDGSGSRTPLVARRSRLLAATVAASLLLGATSAAAAGTSSATAAGVAQDATTVSDPSTLLRDVPSAASARERVGRTSDRRLVVNGQTLTVGADGAMDWADRAGRGRSFLRHLHGHMMVRDLAALALDGDRAAGELALKIVDHWQRTNPRSRPAHAMAWHDETTALRLMSWANLHDALSRTGVAASKLAPLESGGRAHADLLLTDAFHSTGNNHGMFQDRGILAWAHSSLGASAPASVRTAATTKASDRLIAYLTSTVSSDGVHREHSPAYHQVIAGNINRYAGFYEQIGDQTRTTKLTGLRNRMVRYATHVLQPDGTWPLVGDTSLLDRPSAALFSDAGYQFSLSAGKQGTAPRELDAYFPAGGYAIMRDGWQTGRTYLHFTAAYHTDYHKHADDLSVWLYHDGELLTEAGPNGYEYSDPFTEYGYGASAHNGVLLDGHGVPRHDERYGDVNLLEGRTTGNVATARGHTARLPGNSQWERQVRYDRTARRIVVTDRLTRLGDRVPTLLWHTAPRVTATTSNGQVKLQRGGVTTARMTITANGRVVRPNIARAAKQPYAGWRLGGDKPVAATTLTFPAARTTELTYVTTIDLLDPPPTRSTKAACAGAPTARFGDVSGVHAAAVDCLAHRGIANGVTTRRFVPDTAVRRDQMAGFVVRTLDAVDAQLPAAPSVRFRDIAGNPHHDEIARLTGAGVVTGTTATTYAPAAPVTRGQMATFLARTYEAHAGRPLPDGPDYFADDDGSAHERNINRVAAAGLTGGTGRGFEPGAPVSRAQMATFLSRLLAALDEVG